MKDRKEAQLQEDLESAIQFSDIFNLEEIQNLQDLFADAHSVASLITTAEGQPITRPSNFCRLCNDIIRKTEIGKTNCFKSDKYIGCHNPSGPMVQTCLSGGLWDAGASITVGGKHIASWLIGQVRNIESDESQILSYAETIGADRKEFIEALNEVPVMSMDQFNKVAKLLFAFATELSEKAYSNLQLKIQLDELRKTTTQLQESEGNYADIFNTVSEGIAHTTLNGKVLSINNYLEQILEIPKEKIIGKNIFTLARNLLTAKNFKTIIPVIQSILQGKNISEFQFEYKSKIFEITTTRNKETERLTGVVRDITENKLAENKLKFSEERYRLIFENSPVGLLSYDAKGIIVACNNHFAQIIGTDHIKLVGLNMLQLPNKKIVSVIQKSLKGNTGLYEGVYQSVSSNKTSIGRALFAPIPIGNGKIRGGVGIVEDISDRKRMEDALRVSEENYRLIFEHSPLGLLSFNKKGDIIACNASFSNIIGSSTDRLIGLNMLNLPDQNLVDAVRLCLNGMDGYYEDIYQSVTSDKSTPVRGLFSPMYIDGVVHGGVGIIEDITERKRTEEEIEERKLRYQGLSDASFDAIFLSEKGLCIEQNQMAEKMFGYTSEEAIGRYGTDWIIPEHREQVMNNILLGVEEPYEATALKKDGTTFPCMLRGKMMNYKGKSVRVTSLSDISERKKAEERINKLNECFLRFDADSLVNINLLVALCGELLGADFCQYNCIEDNRLYTVGQWNTPENFQAADQPEGHFCHDVIKSPDDEVCVIRNIESSHYALTDPNIKHLKLKMCLGKAVKFKNQNIGSLCLAYKHDVNIDDGDLRIIEIIASAIGIEEDRQQAEKTLRKSEEKYRVLVENSFEGIVIINLEGNILFANHSILKTFEYDSLDEIVGQNIFSHIAPEYVAKTIEDFAKVVQGQDNEVAESCGITAKGNRIWMESIGKIIEYDGAVADLISVHDITAKKQAEERLSKLNDCFLNFESDSLANINRLVSLCGELLGASCSLYNCLQGGMINTVSHWNIPADYQKSDFPEGHICNDVIKASNDKICIIKDLQDTSYAYSDPNVKKYNLKTYIGKAVKFNNQNIGSICVVFQNDAPVKQDDLRVIELIASAIGVEEDRMRAAEALRDNEEKFRKTFYLSPDSVNINRYIDGMYVSINSGFTKIMGYTESDVVGKTSLEINIWDNPEDRNRLIEGLRKNGSVENLEAVFRKKNGEKSQGLMSASVFNLNGVLHIISITRDITERKIAEQAIKDSEAKFKAIADFSASWESWFSPEGKLKWMNSFTKYHSGYTPEEYMASDDYLSMIVAPEDLPRAREKFKEAMNGGSGDNLELQVLRKDGSKFWVSISWRPILDTDGHSLGFRTSAQDITLRKQSEEIFKDIVEKNPLSIQILDLDGYTTQINSAHTTLFGAKTPEDYSLFNDPQLLEQGLGKIFEQIKNGEVVNLPDTQFNVHDVDPSFPDNPVWIKAKGFSLNNNNGVPERIVLMHENITERKLAEKEMNKLRKAIDQSTDAIFMTNIQGIFTFANMGFTSTYGYSADEIIGKQTPRVIKSGLMSNDIYDHFWDALLRGQEVKCELINRRKDGSLIQVEVIANAIFDENGNIIGYVGIQRDITERKLAEEALQKSEKFLKESQLIASLGTYSLDVASGTWESSEVLDAIFGIDEESDRSIGGWVDIIHPDWQETMAEYFTREVIGNRNNFDKEYKIRRKNDGAERWVHGLGNLKFNDHGQLITMIGTIRDITERKLAEENVRKIGKHYQALIEKAPDGIALVDVSGEFKFISPSAKRIFGYSLTEEITGSPIELTHPDDLPMVLSELAKLLEEPNYIPTLQYRFGDGNGNWKWIESTFTNLIADRSVESIVINFRDISERKKFEDELISAKEKAEESDRLKSAFLANMSHEIRTPMNGILGFADLLKEPELTGEQHQEYIRIIEKSGIRMLNIINDIIDISKIESGAMKLIISETSIKEQLEFIANFFRPEAEKKGIILSCKNSTPANKANIKTDREKLYAILTNLVKNAIKFTNSGSIEIGCSPTDQPDGTSLLTFFVKDSGIGIPTDRQNAIFDRFIQADIEDKQAFQGAGLGLAISKAFAEMLGGEIWVESKPGNGSTFYFTIRDLSEKTKISHSENTVLSTTEDQLYKGLKILIAEDDEGSEKLLSFAVNKFCKEILKANTGTLAIDICKKNPDIDLILMDIQMPEINGYEATRQIRQFNKDVIIIAQTAYALSGDREKAIEAGCTDYISKPIKKENLIGLINKYLGPKL